MDQCMPRLMITYVAFCVGVATFARSSAGQSCETVENRSGKLGLALVQIDNMREIAGDPEKNRQAGLDPEASAVVLEPDADGGWTGKFHVLQWFRKPLTDKDISEMQRSIKMKF